MAGTTQRATFADEKDTFEAILQSLFSGRAEDTEADLTKILAPQFRLQAEFQDLDFPGFVKHIRWLRENLPPKSVQLTVTQFLRDGNQLADRHSSTTVKPDGTVAAAETYLFAELAEDGRFAWIKESVIRFPPKGPDGKENKQQEGKPTAEKPSS